MPGYRGGWCRLVPGMARDGCPAASRRTAQERGCTLAATVLVADDDADILRVIEINFRLEGFEVVTARDGPEALAKAIAVRPDLVVLDVLMPGIDGYTTCARIRANASLAAVPVLIVSANYASADREAARRAGADDFLVKPFHPAVLLDKAKAMLS
jgi:DNA-binding response OmpR family regulator